MTASQVSPVRRHGIHFLILFLLLTLLLGLRLFRPYLLPVYYDESLHILRAQRVLSEGSLVMGTRSGKYLMMWLLAPVLAVGVEPLLAGRLVAALSGLLAGGGLYLLSWQLYRRQLVALLAVLFCALSPCVLFLDRMVMTDGLLSALGIWTLLFSLLAVRSKRWWLTLLLGLCLAAANTTKLYGFTFMLFPLLAAWLMGPQPLRRYLLPVLLPAWLLALPGLIPALLDAVPQYDSTLERTWLSPNSGEAPQLQWLAQNLSMIGAVLWRYLTVPLLGLGLLELVRSIRRRDRASWLVALCGLAFLAFFLLTVGAGKLHPRYLLPAFPFLIILAARGLAALVDWLAGHLTASWPGVKPALLAALVLLTMLPSTVFDYHILTDPPAAPWLAHDRPFFIDGQLAGYGIREAAHYLRQEAAGQQLIIVIKRTDNKKVTGAWSYYLDQPNILLDAINFKYADPQQLIQRLKAAPAPVYVVLDRPAEDVYAAAFTDGDFAPYSTFLASFPRPGGASRIEVFRVSTD